ncbi:phospholipase D-like domain-containing protein [Actinomycetospora aeridis]|uniref:phospholipase D n=1 Tax=Actinomycetospora aeridis TaxID=3129231 RepID=A0ABU8N5M3_9PSEU
MRASENASGLTVQAVAGNNVVLLGMDLPPADVEGLLGFGIERTDHTEGERSWLTNLLRFPASSADGRAPRGPASSEHHPLQTFRWGDYSAKPEHDYTYRVVATAGAPGDLRPVRETSVSVRTEGMRVGDHTVVFNRGATASQLYARRFGDRRPEDVPHREAWRWLSRGMEEGILAFIGQARDASWTLRGAFYEFSYAPVLDALRIAATSGADVRLVVEASDDPSSPHETNAKALAEAGLVDRVISREHSTGIAHNKFLVALHDGEPVGVWTGSTNITTGGIFGHSNVGHAVWRADVARAYLDYWEQLRGDPTTADLRTWCGEHPATPAVDAVPPAGETWLMSPRRNANAMLDFYAARARSAQKAMFLTAAFGVTKRLQPVFLEPGDALRYVLMDTARKGIDLVIREADPDNRVSVGAELPAGAFGDWVEESTHGLNGHVRYIHTKYMLVDPLSDDPLVITGSANFSPDSVTTNDENMLVIRGDTAVADVYLTEFMRLFTHYEARYAITKRRTGRSGLSRRGGLAVDDSWTHRWYEPGSAREKERRLFAGT